MGRPNILKEHVKAMFVTGLVVAAVFVFFLWWKGDILQGSNAGVTPKPLPREWTLYGHDHEGAHYYKTCRDPNPSPGVVRVWTQLVYNKEGKKHYVDKRGKYKFSTAGYESFSHRNVLYEINCFSRKKEICIQEVYELTKDGKSLDYAKAGTYKDWSDIPPGSVYDTLYRTVCPEKRE